MALLKRILNSDIEDGSGVDFYDYDAHAQVHRKDVFEGGVADSDIPILPDQSWSELVGGILHTDFSSDDPFFHFNGDEASGTSFYNPQESIESGIETWAAQPQLQPSQDSILDSHLVHLEPPIPLSSHNSPDLLCYGMIYRAAVRVLGNMVDVDAKLKASKRSHSDDLSFFSIEKTSEQLHVKFLDGIPFGILNTQVSKALNDLVHQQPIQFDVIGATHTLRESIGRASKAADAVVRVNINAYGPLQNSKAVGSHLFAHKVYLQRPDHQRPGSTYDNPHILKFSSMQITNPEQHLEVGGQRAAPSHDADEFRKTILDVYASLTRGTNLNRVEGNHRLKTPLLTHQQEALDFMAQRETGPIPPEFRLWKPMNGDNKGWFCHAVTKAKSRIQSSETGGGILADEMGMGKSLSILALVAKTLESAYDWVSTPNTEISDAYHRKKKPLRATLVIVPSAILISEWLNEISVHLDGTLKTVKYHGQNRKTLVSEIEQADIVLTTYHTLVVDFGKKSSPLHDIEWFRVVLDEAHIIRRQVTTFYRAVFELHARSRWCLTGTPIQNRLEDIGALFAFIRVSPFHSMATFRRYITIPFEESDERRAVATRNLTLLLDSLCLRRMRDLLHLPEPQNRTRIVEFSKEERDQYDQTKRIMNRALRHKVGESFTKSTFGMFQVQLQLRILCNHGTYQHSFSWARRSLLNEREDALCLIGGSSEVNCSACRQSMPILGSNNVYRTYARNCAHVLCLECLEENEQMAGEKGDQASLCPLCAISGVPVTTIGPGGDTEDHKDSYLRPQGQSSKMDALVSDIRQDLWTTKSIVFSCWTNTLDLIERYLVREDIPFARIDGDCSLNRRQKILEGFSTTSAKRVLIMTTGTGAFGLNLTSANRVFIIEPQWNPSVENQAVSRAIRLKQKQSVVVTRYMIKGTVEQEMRSQQEKKMKIAEIGTSTSTQLGDAMLE